MYRQVYINPEHRFLQKILWRFNSKDDISGHNLNAVTYGTACAAFLPIQYLHEVDDLLTGVNSFNEVLHSKQTL